LAGRKRKLRYHAVVPDHREPAVSIQRGCSCANNNTVVIGAVGNSEVATCQVRQANDIAALGPGECLATAIYGLDRTANGNSASRHAETLRGDIAGLKDANIENLILRWSLCCCGRGRRRCCRAGLQGVEGKSERDSKRKSWYRISLFPFHGFYPQLQEASQGLCYRLRLSTPMFRQEEALVREEPTRCQDFLQRLRE